MVSIVSVTFGIEIKGWEMIIGIGISTLHSWLDQGRGALRVTNFAPDNNGHIELTHSNSYIATYKYTL